MKTLAETKQAKTNFLPACEVDRGDYVFYGGQFRRVASVGCTAQFVKFYWTGSSEMAIIGELELLECLA